MLRLSHITKRFGANVAVDDVSFDAAGGEIVALVGENGAGKTTLMSIAAGELAADGGTIELGGLAGMVHQHFMLVSEFTIAENLALASPRAGVTSRRRMERDAEAVIATSGIELRGVGRRAGELSVGEKSKLELIKAIARRPRLLILDEPTSVLAPTESRELFAVMRRLASEGTTVVFISHKIAEVLEVATRTVVMRRGRIVAEGSSMTAAELAEAMVPKRGVATAPPSGALKPAALRGSGVALGDLAVSPGEIVAVIGVAGNGQAELAATLRQTLRDGAAHIPEDRTRDGIVATMTIAENLALAAPRWRPREAERRARQAIERFGIRAQSPRQRAGSLSGGNQQKVILARELGREPRVIVAAEPTRGLDIEATRFVHDRLRDAAANGAAILLITSDLDEAFALGDAIHVIFRGRLSPRLDPVAAAERAPALMAGLG
jgi:ABC-type uncharacterized transport system ATPase subunit